MKHWEHHRWVFALIAMLALAGLLGWQVSRERQISACHTSGGAWNGPQSRCDPAPGRPILRRDIDRS